jgi:hypothetical protein
MMAMERYVKKEEYDKVLKERDEYIINLGIITDKYMEEIGGIEFVEEFKNYARDRKKVVDYIKSIENDEKIKKEEKK